MIVNEAKTLHVDIRDSIIDAHDKLGRTPLYQLCEEGFRIATVGGANPQENEDQENSDIFGQDDEEDYRIAHDINEAFAVLNEEEGVKDILRAKQEQQIRQLKLGLLYTTLTPMKEMVDKECKHPSRNQILHLLITNGANPNFISKEIEHTPLHWLAFWGDHRAIKILLKLNKISMISGSLLKNKNDLIKRYGAFNAFFTNNGQTPADIAGTKGNRLSLKNMIDYFNTKDG
jgi:hypothetical protein